MSGWVIQRGPRSFAAVVYLGKNSETGKKKYKWTSGFHTKREAEAHLTLLASHPALGSGVGPFGDTRLRLGEYLQEWLRTLQLSGKERRRREEYIQLHIQPALGHVPLARIHPITLEDFFAKRRERGTNQTTDHHIFSILRAALNRAVRLGLIAANPCTHVNPPQRRKFTPWMWTPEETVAFLVEAKGSSQYYPVFLTAIGTGLRAGELFALRWRDVDLENGVAFVTQTIERAPGGGFVFHEFPKTKHSRRVVRLPDVVRGELQTLRKKQREQKLRLGPQYHDYDLIFCQPNGLPLHPNNIRGRSMRSVMSRAGVPRIRFHDLRHLHATLLIRAGISPKVVQERLGHSALSFTLAQYTHVLPDMQKQAADSANTLLIQAKGVAEAI